MNNLKNRNFNPDSIEGEFPVVDLWSKLRASRIIAGIFAGIFAGVMMQIFGMIYCAIKGMDILAPTKIAAIPFLGGAAMAYGSASGVIVGLIVFFLLSSVLGAVYAHFTGINNCKGLFGVGLTWAAFSWVFITCLFMPSFHDYAAADIPRGVMFFAWIVFGLSLMSVQWFDKKGSK